MSPDIEVEIKKLLTEISLGAERFHKNISSNIYNIIIYDLIADLLTPLLIGKGEGDQGSFIEASLEIIKNSLYQKAFKRQVLCEEVSDKRVIN